MSHRHHGRQRRTHRERQHGQPGIAVAAACDDCAHLIGNPEPSEDGIRMGIVHIGHVAELEGLGWILTEADDGGPPDITCLHYHLEHWEGGHNGCCGTGGD